MTKMKRCLSDTSDNEDLFGEGDCIRDGCPSQSYHMTDRKKRRGVIEKRRRDRINNSLTELRRLVPAAFEKQGSAKLEKAEILQMTVDHLKSMHTKGVSSYGLDGTAIAMDYRMVGFRECAAEVARYMVSIEGMDIQDPLRIRLMTHLQCYCSQREAAVAAKATMQNTGGSWSHMGGSNANSSMQYGSNTTEQLPLVPHPSAYMDGSGGCNRLSMSNGHHAEPNGHNRLNTSSTIGHQIMTYTSTSNSALVGLQTPSAHQFLAGVNAMPILSPNNGLHYNSSLISQQLSQGVKPYRPWGAELVY